MKYINTVLVDPPNQALTNEELRATAIDIKQNEAVSLFGKIVTELKKLNLHNAIINDKLIDDTEVD